MRNAVNIAVHYVYQFLIHFVNAETFVKTDGEKELVRSHEYKP